MAIETAGQQKYADLTAKRIKSLQTGMIVWISLLCLALICSFDNIMLAAIIGCVGLVLAVLNTKARKEFNRKLDRVKGTGCTGIKRRTASDCKRLCSDRRYGCRDI